MLAKLKSAADRARFQRSLSFSHTFCYQIILQQGVEILVNRIYQNKGSEAQQIILASVIYQLLKFSIE